MDGILTKDTDNSNEDRKERQLKQGARKRKHLRGPWQRQHSTQEKMEQRCGAEEASQRGVIQGSSRTGFKP